MPALGAGDLASWLVRAEKDDVRLHRSGIGFWLLDSVLLGSVAISAEV